MKKNSNNNRLNRLLNSGSSNSNLSKSWLYCRWVLYTLFVISIGNIYYLLLGGDYFTLAVFVLVAFLTTFFSKNMVVILSISLVISTILKTVQVKEGLTLSNNDLNTVETIINKIGGVKEGAKGAEKDSDNNESESKPEDSKSSDSSSSKKEDKKESSKKEDSKSSNSSSKKEDKTESSKKEDKKDKKKSKSDEE